MKVKEKEIIISDEMVIKSKIENLKEKRIWITKKARMEAEQRMLKNESVMSFIMTYYNVVILAASVITLKYDNLNLSLLTIVASVFLLGAGGYITTINYKEKIYKYKEAYLKLSKLEDDCELLLLKDDKEELLIGYTKVINEYNSILENSINHEDIDYMSIKVNGEISEPIKVWKYNFIRSVFIGIGIVLPVVIGGVLWK